MAFATLTDADESYRLTLFPDIYEKYKKYKVGDIVEAYGVKNTFNGKTGFNISELLKINRG